MVLRCAVDQPNRWAFRCRTNVKGERVVVRRAAGKLFRMTGPATAKLLIPSVVLVLGTDSNPVPSDRSCRLPATVVRQVQYVGANPCRHKQTVCACYPCNQRKVKPRIYFVNSQLYFYTVLLYNRSYLVMIPIIRILGYPIHSHILEYLKAIATRVHEIFALIA